MKHRKREHARWKLPGLEEVDRRSVEAFVYIAQPFLDAGVATICATLKEGHRGPQIHVRAHARLECREIPPVIRGHRAADDLASGRVHPEHRKPATARLD